YDYRPFGEPIAHAGSAARTDYIGRETDTESDLGSYGVRMYSSEYGRFMSIDPLWSQYSSVSPYHYCLNQPLTQLDPSGLMSAVYDEDGNLLGTDNQGLQGKPIVMRKQFFIQGMNHDDALALDLGDAGLNDDVARARRKGVLLV
ncbi:MAG: RHS repeat-associated core domain-containing protein, partial [bacterium]|nr:RHS repeat-associated core domain-containing protein [bacterium]